MGKRSFFGLEPDQLNELMSLGADAEALPEDNQPDSDADEKSQRPADTEAIRNQPTASMGGVERPGGRIGRYKLLRVLGEGGMGMVYLAEQEGQIRRKVALKVIKPGMDSKRVIARFENERQALALLDHPNIAQVYDAGTTKGGRPYFVMEHVKGSPITDYCDRHKLSIEDRLALFQQICHAVHHAHQKGIIHRDIKPSNILVSTEGDSAVPKIIDFGVAKAVATPLTERTLFTEDTQLLGTPEYMSPEQADLGGEDIDTRSDIYSLGVLLYVLLAGILPYDSQTFRQGGVEHIRKIIRETDPKTPSTRLTKLGEQAAKLAESRRTELAALAKCLHRELEWIPLKAMRKDRSERYRSAIELADDIGNYLSGAPLIAGPPSTVYKLRKFVRRNGVLSAAVLAVAVTLLLGLTATTAMYLRAEGALDKEAHALAQTQEATHRAERAAVEAIEAATKEKAARQEAQQARQEAEQAAEEANKAAELEAAARAEAQAILDFLRDDVLDSARQITGREATVIDVLNAAVARLDAGAFTNQPLREAQIRNTLSGLYFRLGYFGRAVPQRQRRCQVCQEQFGEEHKNTKNAMNGLAISYNFAGKCKEAAKLWEALVEQVHDYPNWFLKCNLAVAHAKQARYKDAERLFQETFEQAGWGPNNRMRLLYSWDLAKVYREQGRYEEAQELFVRTLKGQRQEYGEKGETDRNRAMIRCMNELARLCVIQGDYDEAEALFAEGIEIGDSQLPGKDHPFTMRHVNGLGVLRTKQGRFEEAEALFRRALEGRRLKLGEDHPYVLETINDLGLLRRAQKRHAEAEDLLTEALERRTTKLSPDHPHTLASTHELALVYVAQEDYDKAEPLLLDAYKGRETKLGPEHPQTVDTLRELVNLYESWGKPDEAAKWRAKVPPKEATEE